jgi:hypothetical protein
MRYQVVHFPFRDRYAVMDTGLGIGWVRAWLPTATEADALATELEARYERRLRMRALSAKVAAARVWERDRQAREVAAGELIQAVLSRPPASPSVTC